MKEDSHKDIVAIEDLLQRLLARVNLVEAVIVDVGDNHLAGIDAAQLGQRGAEVHHAPVLRNCHFELHRAFVRVHEDEEDLWGKKRS